MGGAKIQIHKKRARINRINSKFPQTKLFLKYILQQTLQKCQACQPTVANLSSMLTLSIQLKIQYLQQLFLYFAVEILIRFPICISESSFQYISVPYIIISKSSHTTWYKTRLLCYIHQQWPQKSSLVISHQLTSSQASIHSLYKSIGSEIAVTGAAKCASQLEQLMDPTFSYLFISQVTVFTLLQKGQLKTVSSLGLGGLG
eukprot:TRINITY_DN4643_c0_g2_i1.p1 TRINITY_DN4643_c0_g2~~TRINITY_DN4643_c0_g2_i1.p1  ORF type:complete len:202 (-),score=-12.36 TRINITY_DN4643_c0_g2_i1:271-876(-)